MSVKSDLSGCSYFPVTKNAVSYSLELNESVIADYDEGGRVVGIEFLDDELSKDFEKYLALANQKTRGRQNVPKPPSND